MRDSDLGGDEVPSSINILHLDGGVHLHNRPTILAVRGGVDTHVGDNHTPTTEGAGADSIQIQTLLSVMRMPLL